MTTINTSAKNVETTENSSGTLGVVISWDFGTVGKADAVKVPRVVIEEALVANGFDAKRHGFEAPSDEHALARAHREVKWGTRCGLGQRASLVKLKSESGCPASYGVLVTNTDSEETADAKCGARVRVSPQGGFEVAAPVVGEMDEAAERVAYAAAEYADHLASTAFNADISKLLTSVRAELGAVPMRYNGGGVYFLPAGKDADRFVALLDAIEKATDSEHPANQFMAHVTVLRGDARNVRTWTRNTVLSFEAELEQLGKELADYVSRDNVRDSSFDKKRAECGALMLRADKFANLLSGHLDNIKSQLAKLEGEFGSAQQQARDAVGKATSAFARMAASKKPAAAKQGASKNPLEAFKRI